MPSPCRNYDCAIGIDAPDIEDRTAPGGEHLFDEYLAREHRPFQVDRHNRVPAVGIDFKKRGSHVDPGAVDQDVDLSAPGDRLVAQFGERLFRRYVDDGVNCLNPLGFELFDVLFERGVFLDFGGGEIFRFLPFLSRVGSMWLYTL